MFKYLRRTVSTPIAIGIIIASIIILAGGIFAYQYFFVKNSEWKEVPLSQPTEWKTYTSTEYGFEFKYPDEAFDKNFLYSVNPQAECKPKYFWWLGDAQSIQIIGNNPGKLIGSMDIVCQKIGLLLKPIRTGLEDYSNPIIKNIGNRSGYEYLIGISTSDSYNHMILVPLEDRTLVIDFHTTDNNKTMIEEILSTFKFLGNEQPVPQIDTITPDNGPKGTFVEIRGSGLSGFEGDLDVYFERDDGKKVMLTDTFGDYVKTQDKLIRVVVAEPCQKGEKVYGRYSGIEAECDWVELTPGVYKVYVEFPWIKSNIVNFEITASDFPFTMFDTYAHAKQVLAENGWVPYIPDSPNEPWIDAGDSKYPEIGWCGMGIDAICNVNFKKGDKHEHLNVQVGGRPPYGPYSEWTVVGNE